MSTTTDEAQSESTASTATDHPLFEAIRTYDIPAIDALVRSGTDVNAPQACFEGVAALTPLMHAAIIGDPDVLEALLDHGADVNVIDAHGRTALHVAAQVASYPVRTESGENDVYSGMQGVMQILLDAGANIDALTLRDLTPLLIVAADSNPRAVRFLVERGAQIHKDQNVAGSASHYVMQEREHRSGVLKDNPNVRPYDDTLKVLADLAAVYGT